MPNDGAQDTITMSTFKSFENFRNLQHVLITLLAGFAVLMTLATVNSTAAKAEDLIVTYDQSQIIRLPRRISEVIVGNPAIADVAISSGKMLVVTGKAFGITNLIALDAEKQIIANQRIIISRPSARVVNLTRGVGRQSYNCTPECNTSLVIGDDTNYFSSVSSANQTKTKISENATASTGQSGE